MTRPAGTPAGGEEPASSSGSTGGTAQARAEDPGARPPALLVEVSPGDPVAVTGAAGFIGSAIVRRLLARGASVTALVGADSDRRNLEGLDVECRPADVRDPVAVRRALEGCRYVFHAAALYRFWAPRASAFYDVNVGGTRNVLDAAGAAGCERIVYTSTVGVVGLERPQRGEPADEDCSVDIAHLFGHYKRSKFVAEHEVLRAAGQGAPVTLVLPTFPLGPRDRKPTPTGKVVLDFLNGRMPGYVDTSLNVVHVDDLAEGHVRALERGRAGRSYIVGGENVSMRRLLALLAEVTGRQAPSVKVPRSAAMAVGMASELLEGRILRRHPSVPLEAARMSATHMAFDDSRARRELGHTSRPAIDAVADSASWFLDNGYAARTRRRTRR